MRFAANAVDGASRYDKIVSMIEESEKLKSGTENHALELAESPGAVVSGWYGRDLCAHPQRNPRNLDSDGRFLLRT